MKNLRWSKVFKPMKMLWKLQKEPINQKAKQESLTKLGNSITNKKNMEKVYHIKKTILNS